MERVDVRTLETDTLFSALVDWKEDGGADMRRLEGREGIPLKPGFFGTGVAFGDRPASSPFLLSGTIVDTPLVSLVMDAVDRVRGLVTLAGVLAVVDREVEERRE